MNAITILRHCKTTMLLTFRHAMRLRRPGVMDFCGVGGGSEAPDATVGMELCDVPVP